MVYNFTRLCKIFLINYKKIALFLFREFKTNKKTHASKSEGEAMNFKNFKLVKKLKSFSPYLKALMTANIQDLKIASRYIDFLISDDSKGINDDNKKLEEMVRETLIKEFSPEITKGVSYNLLVDAVVHNLKKKQLGEDAKVELD